MTAPTPGLVLPAKHLRTIDADTIEVEVTQKLRIRLLKCYSPEKNTPEGKIALTFVDDLIKDKPLLLEIPFSSVGDFYRCFTLSRILGNLYYNDNGETKDLAETITSSGHGIPIRADFFMQEEIYAN